MIYSAAVHGVLRQVRVLVLRGAAAEAQVPDLEAPAHVHEDVRPKPAWRKKRGAKENTNM